MTEIMDIIESALALGGVDILSVKDNCMVVRNSEQDQDVPIQITDTAC